MSGDPGPMVRTRRLDAIDVAGRVVATSYPLGWHDHAVEFPPFKATITIVAVVPVVGETAVGPPLALGPTTVALGQPFGVEVT